MIEVTHLSKSYGSIAAVRDLSFTVERGDVVGFLGPNGAGKSTTLRILAGFLGMTSGTVCIAGHDVALERKQALSRLGYMPEACPLYPELKVGEYLRFRAELKGVPRRARQAEVGRVLELARVDDYAEVVIGHLSKGYRQRVGNADALLGSPPLLILDEPTAGLDPNQIREVRALVRSLGGKHTVLVSTHILTEVELACTRAIVIDRGRLVAEGSIDEIRRAGGRGRVALTVRGSESEVRRVCEARSEHVVECEAIAASGTARLVVAAPEEELAEHTEELVRALTVAGLGVREVVPAMATLEQVFAELTRDAAVAREAPKRAEPERP